MMQEGRRCRGDDRLGSGDSKASVEIKDVNSLVAMAAQGVPVV